MNPVSIPARPFAALTAATDFPILSSREQFTAELHQLLERYVPGEVPPQDAAYFLITAAKSALERRLHSTPESEEALAHLERALLVL